MITNSVPAGLPAWVTPELFALTKETWEGEYNKALTAVEVGDILLSVGRLLDFIEENTISQGE